MPQSGHFKDPLFRFSYTVFKSKRTTNRIPADQAA
jgi:hypothetical protein